MIDHESGEDRASLVDQSDVLFANVMQTVGEGLVVLDKDLRIVSANASFLNTFDVTQRAAEGHRLFDLAGGQWDVPSLRVALARVVSTGEKLSTFEIIQTFDRTGERINLLNARRIRQPGRPEDTVLLAIQDVTVDVSQRKSERALFDSHSDLERVVEQQGVELEQRGERLRQAEKLEAIGQLAEGIAHDFNNMISAILGYAEMGLDLVSEDDPVHRCLETIHRAGKRSEALTRQLLAFGRRQVLEPRVIDLNELVSSMQQLLTRTLGEDIVASFRPEDGLGRVRVDPNQTEQAILNLAINSRDAMPRGGRLTFETKNVRLDQAYADAHPEVTPGRYVMLAVSDTGTGIDPATRSRIFEPFFTTKPAGEGTGLGLPGIHGFVKQSGGSIWVYSEVGCGTTFKLYLPRVDDEPARQTTQLTLERSSGSETILLVEDNDIVRDLVHEVLQIAGFNVLQAEGGHKALRICFDYPEEIHLMITDVVMPGMGGKELVESLPPSRSSMKVIYTSGYANQAIVHHGVLDEGVDFLQKPITAQRLIRMVRRVLDGEPG